MDRSNGKWQKKKVIRSGGAADEAAAAAPRFGRCHRS
jgi:hypothetical protein